MKKITTMSLKNIVIVLFTVFISIACAPEQPSAAEQPNEVESVNTQEEQTPGVDDKVDNMGESANTGMSSTDNEMNSQNLGLKTIYFAFDKFDLNANNMDITTANADKLSSNDSINVKLEGNCDEWGSDEYNYALGLKRAKSVKNNLVANGINESRISIVSYGESNAVCNERNKACWTKNRRVDTKFLP